VSKGQNGGVGLALGGGGARGLAHIPVLEALDELGVRPERIAGTSIGAIFGAAYASGMTGAEIRAHTLDVLGQPARVLRKLMELLPRGFREMFTRSALMPAQFDAGRVIDLFLPAGVKQDFCELEIPLSIVATDFYGWHEAELTTGPLRQAIAASIALPVIFRPVTMGGRVLIDGGIVNPLPVDKLAGSKLVIAVDVVGGPEKRAKRETPSATEAIFGASQILMQAIITEKLRHDKADILLRPAINQFRVLDFLKARAILEAAGPVKEELKIRLDQVLSAV